MPKNAETIDIDSLVESGHLHPVAVQHLSTAVKERINACLDGTNAHIRETDLTYFMTTFAGGLEQAVIAYLCEVGGIQPTPDMRLISGDAFAQPGRLTIDLIVARLVDGEWVPVIAIEAKFNAYLNGHRNYCRKAEPGFVYSNQAICYPHGCLHDDLSGAVAFIWLAKPNKRPDLGAFGIKGLHKGDLLRDEAYYGDGLKPQQDAEAAWHFATWDALEQRIAAACPGAEGESVIRALRAGW